MAMTGAFEAVVEVALMTMVEEPSRLPTLLPATLPTSKTPDVVPSEMPMKGDEAAVVEARLEVWLMPEMVFPCTLVAVPLLAAARPMPRTSFDEPVMVVVPVPLAAPKPMTLLRMVWALPFAPVVPTSGMPAERRDVAVGVAVRGGGWE